MSLKCGIVGLPNVGKSTLFNALTKAGIAAENYPFCTIEPNTGVVEVPDPRLQQLAEIITPERIVPAIFAGIRRAAFVIAEVSGARPNVFYELGYARASGKAVIQTAYSGTKLPFDVFDVPTLFWGGQSELEGKLKTAIDQFMAKPGRFI